MRSLYHMSRYRWLANEVRKTGIGSPRIIELGCFDAKTISFLHVHPSYYLGLDANWEGGLDQGKRLWASDPTVELRECRSPDDIPDRGTFDIGICMETLEHMSYEMAEAYIGKLSTIISGKLLIAAPHEYGPVFLAKHAIKSLMGWRDAQSYSPREYLLLSLGLTSRVPHCDHKGYDDRRTAETAAKFFALEKFAGIFPPFLPRSLCLSSGIVAKASTGCNSNK